VRFLALGEVVVALFGSGFLAACGSGHKAKSTSLVPPDATGTSPPSGFRIKTIYNGSP
jgi:hypothetical protein